MLLLYPGKVGKYCLKQCCGSASDADPDPACHFGADPDLDPTFYFDTDLDPSFQINFGLSSAKRCGY